MNGTFPHGGAQSFFSVNDFLLLFSFSAKSLYMLCKGCDRRTLISKLNLFELLTCKVRKNRN